jgi:hypothetical protein
LCLIAVCNVLAAIEYLGLSLSASHPGLNSDQSGAYL